MTQVYRFPLIEGAAVVVDPSHIRHASLGDASRVDEIWKKRDTKRLLFDSPIISLVQYSSSSLIGEFVDFRLWYACCKDPELRPILDIHPISVTGLTTWRGMVLVGKRSTTVSSYPGAMECCPSGSIDGSSVGVDGSIDLEKAILLELVDETGIRRDSVRSVRMKDLYLSTDMGVFDVLAEIELNPEIDQPLSQPRSAEYDELRWIQKDQVASIFSEGPWVPLSHFLLEGGSA
jgi:hypothetical protein